MSFLRIRRAWSPALSVGRSFPSINLKHSSMLPVQLSKQTLLQVFAEKREDAAPCVVGAGLVVTESDNA
jgi:hypothetical protein